MKIQTAHFKTADLGKMISRLRMSLGGLTEILGTASDEKTVEVFGRPLSVREVVGRIVQDVRVEGDAAVARYTQKLDGVSLPPEDFRVPPASIEAALDAVPAALVESLRLADRQIREFQRTLLPPDPPSLMTQGACARVRYRPLRRVGVYVPGGAAVYPSSVLMAAVPAQVAGVEEVAVCTPVQKNGRVAPSVLAATAVAGVQEVYRLGGVQAVAALGLGTETVPRVDKIVGPGNMFVTEAKRQLFGEVGIGLLAGPSEVLIIADDSAPPEYLAADLLSQAEHDPGCAVLLTDCEELLARVERDLQRQLGHLARREAALASLEQYGMLAVTRDLEEAARLADAFGPEHLEIMTREPEVLADRVSNAGAIFLGSTTPEAVGDYVAGPSHVLPTGGAARFLSGLSARDFLKATSIVTYSPEALEAVADDVVRLAEAEGLTAHAASVLIRFEKTPRRR